MKCYFYILLTRLIDRNNTNFFQGQPLRALATLAFSDNVDLQRSAALAFAEITEKGTQKNLHGAWIFILPLRCKTSGTRYFKSNLIFVTIA
jgi:hypothetical protein